MRPYEKCGMEFKEREVNIKQHLEVRRRLCPYHDVVHQFYYSTF